MEIFHNPNIDFLGKKWYFIALSLVLSVAGVLSLLFWHGLPLSIDFRGGTLVTVKFSHAPDDAKIRHQLDTVLEFLHFRMLLFSKIFLQFLKQFLIVL